MSKTPTPPAWSGFFITQTQAASNRGLFLFVQAEHRVSRPAVGQPHKHKTPPPGVSPGLSGELFAAQTSDLMAIVTGFSHTTSS